MAKNKKEDSSFKFFPWEKNEKPYFENEKGYEWYIDKSLTKYAHEKDQNRVSLKNIYVFFIRKEDDITRAIIDNKQNVLYESTSMEAIAVRIDILKITNQNE